MHVPAVEGLMHVPAAVGLMHVPAVNRLMHVRDHVRTNDPRYPLR